MLSYWILKQTLQATHFLKLLDKMCKYEMDPTSIVEDTEQTRFCPQMDGHKLRCLSGFTKIKIKWSSTLIQQGPKWLTT